MTHSTQLMPTYALILFICSLLLVGCGGASTPPNTIKPPIQVITPPTTLEVAGTTYQNWEHSEFDIYVSDEAISGADNPLMQHIVSELTALKEVFAVHHQPWLIHIQDESSAIRSLPDYYYLPLDVSATDSERQIYLLQQLLLSKRVAVNSATTSLQLADVLISQAFAHLIAQSRFNSNNPYSQFVANQSHLSALRDALTADPNLAFEHTTRWLIGDNEISAGMGNALMQHAIKHTQTHFSGSDLISLSTLPATTFLPFLTTTPATPPQVSDVRLRTPDISEYDQVPASEMHQLQQSHSTYYLHGLYGKKEVALSFDDGPSVYTSQVLELLATHQVSATFFVLGQNIRNREADIRAIHQQGHLLGNHSYRHTDSSTITANDTLWQTEIANTNDIIFDLVGYAPRLFRPPYGRIRGDQIDYLAARGMRTINWSIDTRDWHTQVVNQQDIEFAASHYSHPEAIILMHDGGGNRSNTVAALENIIQHYKNEGYRFVTLDTLLGIGRAR